MPYTRFNLDTLTSRLTERLGANSTFWTATEKKYALNEAIRVWGSLTWMWTSTIGVPTNPVGAGQAFYNTPRQLMQILRIRHGTSLLDKTSLFDLDASVSSWQTAASGTPTSWAPVGTNRFAIYPPASSGTLLVEGVAIPPALGAGGDFIDLGDGELGPILDYAHFYCTFKEGGLELEAGSALFQNFLSSALSRNERLRASGTFRKWIKDVRDEQQRPPRVKSQGAQV